MQTRLVQYDFNFDNFQSGIRIVQQSLIPCLRHLRKVLRASGFLGTLNPYLIVCLMKWLLWNLHARGVLHDYWTSGSGPVGGVSMLGTWLLEEFLEKGVRRRVFLLVAGK
ncbi:hypothetical protein TNCV_1597911 [Trichonephila clavipes]|nr:hypothetical protein TNCV_1597911 [Trichonephila clavipes]